MTRLGPLFVLIFICSSVAAKANVTRTLSGVIVTQQDELLPGVTISVSCQSGKQKTMSDDPRDECIFSRHISQVSGDPVVSRIHGTPGYPIAFTIRIDVRFSVK